MLSGLITAILQLLASKFAVPFALQAAAALGAAVTVQQYGPVAEPLLYSGAVGVMIFLIGLVISLILGGRVPLIGTLLLTVIFSLIPTALEIYVPGIYAQLMGLLQRAEMIVKMPLDKYVLVGLAAFIGYWLATAMRGPAREY
jgi:hypothetical protein